MKKIDRISRFLKSLEGKGIITADMQSVVFSPEFGMLGGDNEGDAKHNCVNSGGGCEGRNDYCTNEDVCTSKYDNGICKNTNVKSPACNISGGNSDIHLCGTTIIVANRSTTLCK